MTFLFPSSLNHLRYTNYRLRIYARYLQALGKEAGEAELAERGSAGHLAVLEVLASSLNFLLVFLSENKEYGFPCVPTRSLSWEVCVCVRL